MFRQLLKIEFLVLFACVMAMLGSIDAHAATPITPHGAARFQTNTATVNVTQSSPRFQSIWTSAVQAWNRTGVFTFQITNDPNAQVITQMNPNLGGSYSGMTYLTTNNQNLIVKARCDINNQTLSSFHYAKFEWINVAEHELGHAIGLNHNPGKASVMYIANRSYSIQNVDIESVRQLYSLPSIRISTGARSKRVTDPVVNLKSRQAPDIEPGMFGTTIHRRLFPVQTINLAEQFAYENKILNRLANPLYW